MTLCSADDVAFKSAGDAQFGCGVGMRNCLPQLRQAIFIADDASQPVQAYGSEDCDNDITGYEPSDEPAADDFYTKIYFAASEARPTDKPSL